MTLFTSQLQRGSSIAFGVVNVSTTIDEKVHQFCMAVLTGQLQGSPSISAGDVHISSGLCKSLDPWVAVNSRIAAENHKLLPTALRFFPTPYIHIWMLKNASEAQL